MQRSALLLCALALGGAAPAAAASTRAGLGSPVEKVVHLLKDLQDKIVMDGKTEEKVYNKYACWCEKTTARKAEAITNAQDELRQLGQSMLTLKGQVATLASEIAELSENIQENEKTQEKLTSLRQKNNGEFMASTAEMKSVLETLQRAILVLQEGSKQEAFLQAGSRISAAMRDVISVMPASVSLRDEDLAMLQAFASVGQAQAASYSPQSWTVQGILRDMYDTFASNLEEATLTEATQNRQYEDLMALLVKKLKKLQKEKTQKEAEKADAESLLAETTQSYDDTKAQMEADIAFFDETKKACKTKHDEWDLRVQLRKQELEGISKCLDILTGDKARELFADAIKPGKETGMDASLLQLDSSGSAEAAAPLRGAYASLTKSARRVHSIRLAALAVQVREAKVGHFDKVLQMIELVIGQLKEEDAADIAKRDQCVEEYKKTDSAIANVEWLIRKNNAKIDKLERLIKKLKEEKAATIQQIADVEKEMRELRKQRIDENGAFLDAKKKDEDAIKLLTSAKAFLLAYYEMNDIKMGPIQGNVKGLELNQQGPDFDVSADQAPDADFSNKGSRKLESKGVAQLLTMLIEDLGDEIKNAVKAEEDAQLQFMEAYFAAMTLRAKLVTKKKNLAQTISLRDKDRLAEESDKADNKKDLKDEVDYRKEITPDCDWIMGAFAERAERRTAEMEGLTGAKEFLAGYKPASFIQDPRSDAAALSSIRLRGIEP